MPVITELRNSGSQAAFNMMKCRDDLRALILEMKQDLSMLTSIHRVERHVRSVLTKHPKHALSDEHIKQLTVEIRRLGFNAPFTSATQIDTELDKACALLTMALQNPTPTSLAITLFDFIYRVDIATSEAILTGQIQQLLMQNPNAAFSESEIRRITQLTLHLITLSNQDEAIEFIHSALYFITAPESERTLVYHRRFLHTVSDGSDQQLPFYNALFGAISNSATNKILVLPTSDKQSWSINDESVLCFLFTRSAHCALLIKDPTCPFWQGLGKAVSAATKLKALLFACDYGDIEVLKQLLKENAFKALAFSALNTQSRKIADPRVMAVLLANIKGDVAELSSLSDRAERNQLLNYEPYAKKLAANISKEVANQINHPVLSIYAKLTRYGNSKSIFKNHCGTVKTILMTPNITLQEIQNKLIAYRNKPGSEVDAAGDLSGFINTITTVLAERNPVAVIPDTRVNSEFDRVLALSDSEKNQLLNQDLQARAYASVWSADQVDKIGHSRLTNYYKLIQYAAEDASLLYQQDHSSFVLKVLAKANLTLEMIHEELSAYCKEHHLSRNDSLVALVAELPENHSNRPAPKAAVQREIDAGLDFRL